jgi:protein-tyrosine-phosphatase
VTGADSGQLRILTVCSHNRTRSVMMAALLESMLTDQLRVAATGVVVRSAGFAPAGMPAISDAVDAMRRRGLDVSSHLSHQLTADDLDAADLVLTAERVHVVRIASVVPSAFPRTMTLPEFVDRATATRVDTTIAVPPGAGPSGRLAAAVDVLTTERTPQGYLRDVVPEVDDPTGLPRRAFEAAVVVIEQQCRDVAAAITSWVHHAR